MFSVYFLSIPVWIISNCQGALGSPQIYVEPEVGSPLPRQTGSKKSSRWPSPYPIGNVPHQPRSEGWVAVVAHCWSYLHSASLLWLSWFSRWDLCSVLMCYWAYMGSCFFCINFQISISRLEVEQPQYLRQEHRPEVSPDANLKFDNIGDDSSDSGVEKMLD